MGSFNLGQNKASEVQKTNTNRKIKGKINTPNTALKQTKEQPIQSGAHHSKGLGSKENKDTFVQNSKGSWRRLTRESSTSQRWRGRKGRWWFHWVRWIRTWHRQRR